MGHGPATEAREAKGSGDRAGTHGRVLDRVGDDLVGKRLADPPIGSPRSGLREEPGLPVGVVTRPQLVERLVDIPTSRQICTTLTSFRATRSKMRLDQALRVRLLHQPVG